ncbi:Biopolymer transport protein ExbB [Methyloligella halotolerans]|uniref:Biopolymer transport protein ExbB n=1 Tax=Methyloligella halotolerans TaxID=1177755 RepID=A0A1E2RZC3_9HYPH|nr:MotA/TolQ/ExbB proton channel family protein [Methyloligella halotolerans]ODA67448.1 Biopolymer transport protein ExbB [Methyloligella halotolerans]
MEHIATSSADYTVYGLVMAADPVVKGVMILLVLASVACWAIIFEKLIRVAALNRQIKRLTRVAHQTDDELPPPHTQRGLVGHVLNAAEAEVEVPTFGNESLSEFRGRLEHAMRGALRTDLQKLESGLPFLATTGSAAPFIGLFGTVWGIVNSFTAIAQAKDTSLAVVAPGIAEALIATALGLAAAIPAVVAYNMIAVALGRASNRANAAVTEIARRIPHARPSVRKAAE